MVYVVEYKSYIGKHWHPFGHRMYANPRAANEDKLRLEREQIKYPIHQKKEYRVTKYAPRGE